MALNFFWVFSFFLVFLAFKMLIHKLEHFFEAFFGYFGKHIHMEAMVVNKLGTGEGFDLYIVIKQLLLEDISVPFAEYVFVRHNKERRTPLFIDIVGR